MNENTERRKSVRIDHTSALKVKNGKKSNIKGQIVWADDEGFGVIFMSKS